MIVFSDVSYDISTGIIRALTLQGDVSVGVVFPVISWAGRFCKAASKWQRSRRLERAPQGGKG